VIAFDPYVSKEDGSRLGVEMATLESSTPGRLHHVPHAAHAGDEGMVNAAAIAKMKDGVRIINCAAAPCERSRPSGALQSGRSPGRRSTSSDGAPPPDMPLLAHPT